MEHFTDKLIRHIRSKRSSAVAGLDPRWKDLPAKIKSSAVKEHGRTLSAGAAAVTRFITGIIDAVAPHVPAVKPQVAFYEQFGVPGLEAYRKICEHAKARGLIVIGDVKRSDIGSTAEAYAAAHLGRTDIDGEALEAFPVDAVTVNAFLGHDGVKPFIDDAAKYGKGLFVLVKTSNPSSAELQDLDAGGEAVYVKLAKYVAKWGEALIGESGYSAVGAVVGATCPEAAQKVRAIMPRSYILVPGYGAQGAGAAELKPFYNADGLGAIVNSSRGIIFACKSPKYKDRFGEDNWQRAAEQAAIDMNAELHSFGLQ
jgi:orotidine-5'-phosphate decarboxylase